MDANLPRREVYLVDGARTPFLKARGKPGMLSASDLAVNVGKELLARQPFAPSDINEVIIGCVIPSSVEANIARVISLRLGCGIDVPAWTVQRNCASGMQAIDNAYCDIADGRHDLVLAGGTESMSQAPLLYNAGMVNWLADFNGAKSFTAKIAKLSKFKPSYLSPIFALMGGLTDPIVNLTMGQTAEILAYRFGVTREEMDAFAVESHRRVARAQDENHLKEILPMYDTMGTCYMGDDGLRRDSTPEKLATLKPVFDKKFGNVTAGNSAQITDGAAMLLLASKEAVLKYKLPILARIKDVEWAGLEPSEMGLGPVYASTRLMQRNHLKKDDIDYWEINEAFAAQVLACRKAWESESFCKEQLKLPETFGSIDLNRLNVDGGGVALGHPVGASGARITLHLANVLRRENAKQGIASICIGGGQGGAMLIENVSSLPA